MRREHLGGNSDFVLRFQLYCLLPCARGAMSRLLDRILTRAQSCFDREVDPRQNTQNSGVVCRNQGRDGFRRSAAIDGLKMGQSLEEHHALAALAETSPRFLAFGCVLLLIASNSRLDGWKERLFHELGKESAELGIVMYRMLQH